MFRWEEILVTGKPLAPPDEGWIGFLPICATKEDAAKYVGDLLVYECNLQYPEAGDKANE